MRWFTTIIFIVFAFLMLVVIESRFAEKPLPTEQLSIEGFVRAVEINRRTIWFGDDIIIIGFEDGRVKFFRNSLPDMVKQGANNRIYYIRKHLRDGSFYDKIDGITTYPEPK